MKTRSLLVTFIMLFALSTQLLAQDGMWMPHQMKMLNLQKQGLQMNPDDLFKKDGTGLMSAVVHLGGGTGEFVSKEGLILTNHHVAFGAIQRASDTENDYIKHGFIASTKEKEIPALGYIANVLLGYEDVTDKVMKVLKPKMTFEEKHNAINKIKKKLIEAAEKEGKDIQARFSSMYSGNKYYLFRFKHIKDVRLVYAPPRDLGNYGGDINNWMWPRHTNDFTFLRAYVSPEGEGAAFSKENVPYKPKSVMKISLDGLKEGDFTFVMGYPGRTYRNYTHQEVVNSLNTLKSRLNDYLANIAFYEAEGENNREIEIKYARTVKGMHNARKNYQGKLEGFEKINLLGKKKDQEAEVAEWIKTNAKSEYTTALADFETYLNSYDQWSSKNTLTKNMVSSRFSSTILAQAHYVYRVSVERQKKDSKRPAAYQNKNWDDLKRRNLLTERGYDLTTDRKFLKFRLKRLMNEPFENMPQAVKDLMAKKSEAAIDKYVDYLYDNTKLGDPQERAKMLEMSPEELMNLNDPMIKLAAELEKELKVVRKETKAKDQEYKELKAKYLAAVLEMKDNKYAPDANSTIRFTYGTVEGYRPKDAVYYEPFTTLKGVMEKETGEFPFHVPQKLKDLYKAKDFGRYKDAKTDDVVTCFLNTTNVTGGNSGSPTLNAKGEQVGIIFDMTYESVTGDYYVVPELQRTISVDIRYVLFVTEKFSGAGFILDEIGL